MDIIIDEYCVFSYDPNEFKIHLWRHAGGRYKGPVEYDGSITFCDDMQMQQFVEMCLLKVGEQI